MATQQRLNSRKGKLSTTTTEEIGAETAPAKDTSGKGGLPEAAEYAVANGHENGVVGFTEEEYAKLGSKFTEEKLVSLGLTKKELAKLRPKSLITDVSDPYCPLPKKDELLLGYETLVTAIQRHPEMRKIEKTDVIKKIHYENQIIRVPKTRVITEPIERFDQVIVVRKVAKTVPKTFYRVVEEVREVTELVDVVEYIDVPRIEEVSRVITEYVEEEVSVPVVREMLDKRTVEVPTGNYCKYSLSDFKFIEDDLTHDFKGEHDSSMTDVSTTITPGPRPQGVGA